MGPANPVAGGQVPRLPRSGLAGANRFQDYLDTLAGPQRTITDRSVIGLPYYRSTVDPAWAARREYRPNELADQGFEQTQQRVTDTYLAYFSERDPRRRAALLRDYRQARRDSSRVLGMRRGSPAGALEPSTRRRSATEPMGPAEERDDALPRPLPAARGAAAERAPSSAMRPGSSDSVSEPTFGPGPGPPPPIPPVSPSRIGDRSRRSPMDVLRRSRGLESRTNLTPGLRLPATGSRRTEPRSFPPPPLVDPE
jgi:hypothetical protein